MVDKLFIKQLQSIHGELDTLTYDEIIQMLDLLDSDDEDIKLTGQSILYLSNFFAIPHTCKFILEKYKNRDGDFKSLDKIVKDLNEPITEYDSQILNKLKDDRFK
jgi:hypothetical protein